MSGSASPLFCRLGLRRVFRGVTPRFPDGETRIFDAVTDPLLVLPRGRAARAAFFSRCAIAHLRFVQQWPQRYHDEAHAWLMAPFGSHLISSKNSGSHQISHRHRRDISIGRSHAISLNLIVKSLFARQDRDAVFTRPNWHGSVEKAHILSPLHTRHTSVL